MRCWFGGSRLAHRGILAGADEARRVVARTLAALLVIALLIVSGLIIAGLALIAVLVVTRAVFLTVAVLAVVILTARLVVVALLVALTLLIVAAVIVLAWLSAVGLGQIDEGMFVFIHHVEAAGVGLFAILRIAALGADPATLGPEILRIVRESKKNAGIDRDTWLDV